MADAPSPLIANILHRGTLEALVGARTFERGERCLRGGRVLAIKATKGQLLGSVRPSEARRADYGVRIWIKDDGIAYHCSCPVGSEGRFCKHAVAVALAFVEEAKRKVQTRLATLTAALSSLPPHVLVERLTAIAIEDERLLALLTDLVGASGPPSDGATR